MQVSHVNEFVTHAVIGGKQAIEFGISNSAEFFNILSSTLYKDQILAVVREVLCNAWDAHIEAGCTDRPVQITLDSDKFTVKDFGKGIHHDDMGLIYGTYGNSTKKNDGTQTGGFGLGCKAPFAYTDHFEVTSSHAGTKTIYNLSKSSAQAMGKPGIIPIASFPTEDAGLTVSMRIKPSDQSRFNHLIKRIVCNGDMNMTLNSKQLDTIEFDVSKGNYLITTNDDLLDRDSRIMVRYGNVIYPVDNTKEIQGQHDQLIMHLEALRSGNTHYYMVFQAPANSISVTPSRESLSMQEHTVNTLNTLFSGFLDSLAVPFATVCNTYAETLIAKAVTDQRIDELLKRDDALPDLHEHKVIPVISDLGVMAQAYMQKNYPKGLEYRKADITNRLKLMAQHNLLDRGKVQTFLLALKEVKLEYEQNSFRRKSEKSSWLQRRVVAPLLNKLSVAGLDTDRLFVCDYKDTNYTNTNRENMPPLVPAIKAKPEHLLATLPYLRNIIVITSKRHELVNTAYNHEAFDKLGEYHGFLVYTVGRKASEVEAVQQFFTKSGMRVIDLTIEQAKERATNQIGSEPRKPVKKGLAALSSVRNYGHIKLEYSRDASATRITTPECVIQLLTRDGLNTSSLPYWNRASTEQLVTLFGDKCGVTTTKLAHEKWIKNGAKEFDDYVIEKVSTHVLFNPRIHEYWAFNPDRLIENTHYLGGVIKLIYSNSTLKDEFNLINNLTDEDKIYLSLLNNLKQNYKWSNNLHITKINDWLNTIPLDTACNQLVAKLTDNNLLDLLDIRVLQELISNSRKPVQAKKAIDILLAVLNP